MDDSIIIKYHLPAFGTLAPDEQRAMMGYFQNLHLTYMNMFGYEMRQEDKKIAGESSIEFLTEDTMQKIITELYVLSAWMEVKI